MIRSTLRRISQLLGGLGAGLAVILLALAWQLSSGPVSLGLLTPYIERVINSEQQVFRLAMEDTILTWAGWDRTLDIRVIGVKLLRPNGVLIGSIPEVSFALSGRGLISGLLVPQTIELFRPRLKIIRDQSSVGIGFANPNKKTEKFSHDLLDQLLAEADPNNPTSYLKELEIINAEITLEDKVSGKSWIAQPASVRLKRDKIGIVGDILLALNIDGRNTNFNTTIGYQSKSRRIDVTTKFSDISPKVISSIFHELKLLQVLALPIKGSISAGLSLNGVIEAASFNLFGGQGKIILPGKFAQNLSIEELKLKGRYEGVGEVLDIDELFINLGSEGSVLIPSKTNYQIPLSSVRGKGQYFVNNKRLVFDFTDLDLQGPTASLNVVAKNFSSLTEIGHKSLSMEIKGSLRDLPINQLSLYWPPELNEDSRRWALANLSEGLVHNIRAEGTIYSDDEVLKVLSVDGDMELSGVSVKYLSSMPPVQKTEAYIKFDKENFNVFISSGHSELLNISDSSVLISGLDKYDQIANIVVKVDGKLEDKLTYLDRNPLNYTSAVGVDSKNTQGFAETKLKLNFIIENQLTLNDIKISSQSLVKNFAASKILFGHDLKGGPIKIDVDKEGMDVSGKVTIGKIPLKLSWRENFNSNGSFKRRYKIKPHISNMKQINELDLNLNFESITKKYIRGGVDAEVDYTIFTDDKRRLQIKVDLLNSELKASAFGWSKMRNIPGRASITIDFERDLISNIPTFSIDSSDLKVMGQIGFEKGSGKLNRIDFQKIIYGRTDIKGALTPRKVDGWDARFYGSSFELTPIWEDIFSKQPEKEDNTSIELPYLNLVVEIDRVWVGQEKSLINISGTFIHKDDVWNTVLLKGDVGKGKPFELSIRPSNDGNRDFVLTAAEAGEALRVMDFYDEMRAGKMQITGQYKDKDPNRPLIGKMIITDYKITDAPYLARALSIMSLTGILDELEGEGLKFDYLEIPFIQGPGELKIKDANASGTSIGFTGSGTIYTYADVLNITGTVVPAYVLNSALGHLPVIGDILTGGDKGSGVIAFNYSMSGTTDEPNITVNPLSALTPGIFRNVFDFFGKDTNNSKNNSIDSLQ